jgi:hypothetical protein
MLTYIYVLHKQHSIENPSVLCSLSYLPRLKATLWGGPGGGKGGQRSPVPLLLLSHPFFQWLVSCPPTYLLTAMTGISLHWATASDSSHYNCRITVFSSGTIVFDITNVQPCPATISFFKPLLDIRYFTILFPTSAHFWYFIHWF